MQVFRFGNLALGALAAVSGLAAGVGGYTFVYAKGASYLSDDAAVCANCHVMRDHLDAWQKGPHHAVATCNDCHTPHDFFGKYFVKGRNGYHHSLAFTTGNYPQPIRITPFNRAVTQEACRYCHADIVQAIDATHRAGQELDCIRCHADVGHIE